MEVDQTNHVDETNLEEISDNDESTGISAWADCMTKILSTTKPASQRFTPLSRAKKMDRKKPSKEEEQECDFEITHSENMENDLTTASEPKTEKEKLTTAQNSASLNKKLKMKNMKLKLRANVSWKDMDRERTLRKVATKGVVQLFNAVRAQQRDLDHKLEEAGPLDSRRTAVLNNVDKKRFLDYLMSGKRSQSEHIDNPVKSESIAEEEEDESESSSNEDNSEPLNDKKHRLRKCFSTISNENGLSRKSRFWDLSDEEANDTDEA